MRPQSSVGFGEKNIYKLKNWDKAWFYVPGEVKGMSTPITSKRPEERILSTKERTRLNDKLDPKVRGYLEWLSANWEEYFAKERDIPTSCSSSQWSSTSWWSPLVVFELQRMATTPLAG